MQPLGMWEQIFLAALVVVLLIWMGPGIKASFAKSKNAQSKDWMGVLIPLALVVLFVVVLIMVT